MAAEHEATMGMILEEAVIQEFRATLRGKLLRSSEDGYDDARKVFNGMIDKRPALIVRCAGVADVINAVNFARTNELLVAVRGGGHNVAGYAVCDGGVVIDLSQMKGMRVDPSAHTARAEAGLTWGEFNHEAQAFGLAGTGGFVSTTGIAGLTLGGGSRLAGAQVWPCLGQSAVCRYRDCRWAVPDGQRNKEPGALLGCARWRRESRYRHFV